IDPVSVRIHGVTPSTFFFRHDLSGIPQPLHAPFHDAFFWSPSMSDRPTVLDSSTTDETPRSPVTTTVQRTADPPSDTSRRERAAEQARQEQQAAHEQLLLTAAPLHMRGAGPAVLRTPPGRSGPRPPVPGGCPRAPRPGCCPGPG